MKKHWVGGTTIRTILLSGVIAGLATVAQANDRQVRSQTYWDYIRCNEDAARNSSGARSPKLRTVWPSECCPAK